MCVERDHFFRSAHFMTALDYIVCNTIVPNLDLFVSIRVCIGRLLLEINVYCTRYIHISSCGIKSRAPCTPSTTYKIILDVP